MPRATALLALGLFCLSYTVYLSTPLANDIIVFWGSSRLADIQYGGGLHGALQSWELKPFMNRLFFYFIYKVSLPLHDPDNRAVFPLALKLAYLPFILVAGFCMADISRRFSKKTGQADSAASDEFTRTLVCLAALPLASFGVILQPEYNALLFAIVGISLLLRQRPLWISTGMLLLATVPFFKLITVVYVFQGLLALHLLFGWSWRKTFQYGLGFMLLSGLLLCAVWVAHPQEIQDMLDAVRFHSSHRQSLSNMAANFYWSGPEYALNNFPFHPLLPPSLLCLAAFIITPGGGIARIAGLLLCWLAGWAAVVIQGQFLFYHFAILYPAALLTLPAGMAAIHRSSLCAKKLWMWMLSLTCCVSLILFLMFASPVEGLLPSAIKSLPFFPSYEVDWQTMQRRLRNNHIIADYLACFIEPGQTALYLERGAGVWMTGMKSASRYFYPLPLKSLVKGDGIGSKEAYRQMICDMNQYDGPYVLYHKDWIDLEGNPMLEGDIANFLEHLGSHYFPLQALGGYVLYIRKDS